MCSPKLNVLLLISLRTCISAGLALTSCVRWSFRFSFCCIHCSFSLFYWWWCFLSYSNTTLKAPLRCAIRRGLCRWTLGAPFPVRAPWRFSFCSQRQPVFFFLCPCPQQSPPPGCTSPSLFLKPSTGLPLQSKLIFSFWISHDILFIPLLSFLSCCLTANFFACQFLMGRTEIVGGCK